VICVTLNYFTKGTKISVYKSDFSAYFSYLFCQYLNYAQFMHFTSLLQLYLLTFGWNPSSFNASLCFVCFVLRKSQKIETEKHSAMHFQVDGSQFESCCFRLYFNYESYKTGCVLRQFFMVPYHCEGRR